MEQGELESLGADEQVVPLSEVSQLRAGPRAGVVVGQEDPGSRDPERGLGADPLKLLLRSNWPGPGKYQLKAVARPAWRAPT